MTCEEPRAAKQSAGAPRWQRIGITTAAAWLRDDGLFRAGSAGGDAVVEIDDRAVIAARGVGGEEGDHLGNIVDPAQAAQWRGAFDTRRTGAGEQRGRAYGRGRGVQGGS